MRIEARNRAWTAARRVTRVPSSNARPALTPPGKGAMYASSLLNIGEGQKEVGRTWCHRRGSTRKKWLAELSLLCCVGCILGILGVCTDWERNKLEAGRSGNYPESTIPCPPKKQTSTPPHLFSSHSFIPTSAVRPLYRQAEYPYQRRSGIHWTIFLRERRREKIRRKTTASPRCSQLHRESTELGKLLVFKNRPAMRGPRSNHHRQRTC
jgi:hypothetical protein